VRLVIGYEMTFAQQRALDPLRRSSESSPAGEIPSERYSSTATAIDSSEMDSSSVDDRPGFLSRLARLNELRR
jgi:hypothetical protein